MKHFSAQTGGRYTYTDDIENLQSLALAVNSIFEGCDNFIISGCEVNGSSISPGYVYINGEIRRFAGASNQTWPRYIYEHNINETVAYVSGSSKVGRVDYGVQIGSSVPTTLDAITGAVPQYILITTEGGRRMKDAFFGKYALTLNPALGSQTINGVVNFTNDVNINKDININKNISVLSGSKVFKCGWNEGVYTMEATEDGNTKSKMVFNPVSGVSVYINNNLIQTINENGVVVATGRSISTPSCLAGNILVSGSEISEYGTGSDSGIRVNLTGHNGGTNFFRDFIIGNGKGSEVFKVLAKDSKVASSFPIFVESSSANIVLKDTLHPFSSLASQLSFVDKDNVTAGSLGYAGNTMKLTNAKGNIEARGTAFVDLGPAIKENGVLLSDKYVTITTFNNGLGAKANSSDIYTKTTADSRFAKLSEGFSQFVGNLTKKNLRDQIGATSIEEVKGTHAQLDKFLSDMAKDETAKRTIRNNIGAAPINAYQDKLYDSGWIKVNGQNEVYARQIGNIVCIQGNAEMNHNDTLFTLPSGIGSPAHSVGYRADGYSFGAYIKGGTRTCISECESNFNHGKKTSFSMTYMTA